MKKLALVLGCALLAQVGFAQTTIDPEVGINFANQRSVMDGHDATRSDASVNFSAGVGVNIPFSEGLYLKPGIYYQKLGSEVKTAGVTTTTNLHYLQVPVNLGYRYQISDQTGVFFAQAGPYVGYALDGDNNVKKTGEKEKTHDINFGDGADEVNRFDWGFKFGVGYETPWGIYVKGSYGLGLGNLSNVSDVTMTNRSWNIGVGYHINL